MRVNSPVIVGPMNLHHGIPETIIHVVPNGVTDLYAPGCFNAYLNVPSVKYVGQILIDR